MRLMCHVRITFSLRDAFDRDRPGWSWQCSEQRCGFNFEWEQETRDCTGVSLHLHDTVLCRWKKNHQGDAPVTSPCNHVTICPPLCLRMHGMGEYVLKAALPVVVSPQRKRTLLLSTRRWMSLAEGFYVPWTSVTFSLLWHIHAGESPGCVNRTSFSFFPHLLWNVTTCGRGHVWIWFLSLIFSVPDTFPREQRYKHFFWDCFGFFFLLLLIEVFFLPDHLPYLPRHWSLNESIV